MENLPEGILLAWYGDDFTGSAAVMEVLTFAGIPAMLFLDVPTQAQLARYPDLKAIGVASTARAQSPEWMDRELPPIFSAMSKLNPTLFHYKACSTLDSSNFVGSIGRAIEIGFSAKFLRHVGGQIRTIGKFRVGVLNVGGLCGAFCSPKQKLKKEDQLVVFLGAPPPK